MSLKAFVLTKTSAIFQEKRICGFCQNPFRLGEKVVVCPQCGAVHHANCWQANGSKCTTHLCSGTGVIAAPPSPQAKSSVTVSRDTLIAALAGGFIVVILFIVVGLWIVLPRIHPHTQNIPVMVLETLTTTTDSSYDRTPTLERSSNMKPQTPTSIPTIPPTKIYTPLPTRTRPPTPTSEPSTPTPQPTPCSIGPGPTLHTSWNQRQLQFSLGCPLDNEYGVITAYQAFEKGFMIWRQDNERIYVILNNGIWEMYNNTWSEGQPEYTCPETAPSNTPPTPRRGFGEIWCKESGLRERIGNAVSDEIGNPRSLQDFQNGVMFAIPEAGVYILFRASYRWTN